MCRELAKISECELNRAEIFHLTEQTMCLEARGLFPCLGCPLRGHWWKPSLATFSGIEDESEVILRRR